MTELTLKRKDQIEQHHLISLCRELDEHKKLLNTWMERALIAEALVKKQEDIIGHKVPLKSVPAILRTKPYIFLLDEKLLTLTELASAFNLTKTTIEGRLAKGIPPDKAVLPREEFMEWRRCG